MINWKLGRWIALVVAVSSFLLLTGIADSVLGISLTYEFIGFKVGTIVGIGNLISAWILYKVL